MHKKIGVSIYIIIGGLLFNLAFYILSNHLIFFGNKFDIFNLIRYVSTIFLLTIGHTLIVFLVLYVLKCFKKQWPSFLIPSIIITTLTFIVVLLGNIDKYAELAEPQEQTYQRGLANSGRNRTQPESSESLDRKRPLRFHTHR